MLEVAIGLLGTAILGVFGWAFVKIGGLDTRVAVLEADRGSLEKLLQVQFDDVKRRLEKIETSLEDIKER